MAKIEYSRPAQPLAVDITPAPTLTDNIADNRLELRFPCRPGRAFRLLLRATRSLIPGLRWKWHHRGRFWYAQRNEATRKFATAILAQARQSPGSDTGGSDQYAGVRAAIEQASASRQLCAIVYTQLAHVASVQVRQELAALAAAKFLQLDTSPPSWETFPRLEEEEADLASDDDARLSPGESFRTETRSV